MFCPGQLTISAFHCLVFAFSFVQYRTCKVPEDRPGKKSAICFQVRFFFSFSSMRSWSSSVVNFNLGPLGRGAGSGMPVCPTTLGAPPTSSRRITFALGSESGRRWWWCVGGGWGIVEEIDCA